MAHCTCSSCAVESRQEKRRSLTAAIFVPRGNNSAGGIGIWWSPLFVGLSIWAAAFLPPVPPPVQEQREVKPRLSEKVRWSLDLPFLRKQESRRSKLLGQPRLPLLLRSRAAGAPGGSSAESGRRTVPALLHRKHSQVAARKNRGRPRRSGSPGSAPREA